jgi:hypothetical protein
MVCIYILIGIIGLVIAFRYIKRKEVELEKSFQQRFAGQNILLKDKYALYIAQQSDGYSHTRGTGYLVLTDQELYFKRQFGNKVISMPLQSILQASETLRLGGQSIGKSLLKVSFRNQQGKEDAVAWRVKDLHRWKNEIQKRIMPAGKSK